MIIICMLMSVFGILIGFWIKNIRDEGKKPLVITYAFLKKVGLALWIVLQGCYIRVCVWVKYCVKKSKKTKKADMPQQ